MKILVVEDDLHLAEALERILVEQGYFVDKVYNGIDGLYFASSQDYDAIVLDVMLPKMTGFEVIRTLRRQKVSTPTLLLTAKSEIGDKVTGLDAGADDYMIKPFSPEELLARLRALTRRVGDVALEEMTCGDIALNLNSYALSSHTKSVTLSNKEYSIMKLFLANPDMILSKDHLIEKVWGHDSDREDNNVEAYVSFLRKKLGYLQSRVQIVTVRMAGYKLSESDQ